MRQGYKGGEGSKFITVREGEFPWERREHFRIHPDLWSDIVNGCELSGVTTASHIRDVQMLFCVGSIRPDIFIRCLMGSDRALDLDFFLYIAEQSDESGLTVGLADGLKKALNGWFEEVQATIAWISRLAAESKGQLH